MKLKKQNIILLVHFLLIFFTSSVFSANLLKNDKFIKTRIFYSQQSIEGWDGIIIGRVLSLGMREEASKDDIGKLAQDKTKITVRLFDYQNINKNEDIFVINEKNLVVARFKIKTILKSKSFGNLLVGYGNFRLVTNDFRVVLKQKHATSKYAYIYKSRGDFYKTRGDISKAIIHYEKSIKADSAYPESHLELGYIYLDKKLINYALKEFHNAEKFYNKIVDVNDRYKLLMGISKASFKIAYESSLPKGHGTRNRYIQKGLTASLKALKLRPESEEANFYSGYYYYNNPNPDDLKSKKLMLKVIDLNPEEIKAFVVLSRLYKKHRNDEKALFYAEKAYKLAPTNEEVKNLMKIIKNYKSE